MKKLAYVHLTIYKTHPDLSDVYFRYASGRRYTRKGSEFNSEQAEGIWEFLATHKRDERLAKNPLNTTIESFVAW